MIFPRTKMGTSFYCPRSGARLTVPDHARICHSEDWLERWTPWEMLVFITRLATGRKLRLLACGCCRLCGVADDLPELAALLQLTEHLADQEECRADLLAAHARVSRTERGPPGDAEGWLTQAGRAMVRCTMLSDARLAAGATFHHALHTHGTLRSATREKLRGLLFEIFGNPFTPVALEPACMAWQGGKVRTMAQQIYAERAFRELPILADALEEAGCEQAGLLAHLRAAQTHLRGCWALDLLLTLPAQTV